MVIASVFALALAAAQTPPAPPARDPDVPSTAPTDDYGFVAWCHGALRGHMELHDRVKPELDKVSPGQDDSEQTQAGREYLEMYARALKAAEKASPNNIHDRGLEANAAGYRIWAAARTAEPRTQMWSYLMWELPARCEVAATRLEERSNLFGEALRSDLGTGPAPQEPAAPLAAADSQGLRGAQ
jgi:hypothetical protein